LHMGLGTRDDRRYRRVFPRGSLVAALFALFLASPGTVLAQQDPFADISATTADIEARGVTALAISGNLRAAAVIDALRDGKLYAWKYPRPDTPLFISTDKGFVDARTGDPVDAPAPANLRKVIVSDTVRSAIETAEGALDLISKDPAARRKAAEALFLSANPSALPLIDKALAAEQDSGVARVLREARAAALLKSDIDSVPDRLAAVQEIAGR